MSPIPKSLTTLPPRLSVFVIAVYFPLLVLVFTTMSSIVHAFRHSPRHVLGLPAASILSRPLSLNTKNSLQATAKIVDLPTETLYILDGTAMLYQAHFSRESKEGEFATATFATPYAKQLRGRLSDKLKSALDARDALLAPGNDGTDERDILTNNVAMPCNAVAAMAMTFARFVRNVRPGYVAAVFDTDKKTFRSSMMTSYKKQRPEVRSSARYYLRID